MICESCTRGSPRLHQRQCMTLFVEESLFCVFLLSRFVSLDDTHNYYILFLFSLCSPEFGGYSSSSFLQTPPTCLHNNRISKRLKVKDFNSCYRYATYSHHLCAILSAGLIFFRGLVMIPAISSLRPAEPPCRSCYLYSLLTW